MRRLVVMRCLLVPVAGLCLLLTGNAVGSGNKWEYTLSAAQQESIAGILPASLRGHLAFLASDLLQGRGNGASGLDIAAEYIAAQFRRAGLEAVGGDGYFQNTPKIRLTPTLEGYRCRISVEGREVEVMSGQFTMTSAPVIREFHVDDAKVFKLPFGGQLSEEIRDLRGSVVITEYPPRPQDRSAILSFNARRQEFLARVRALNPALLVEVRRSGGPDSGYFGSRMLVDPDQNRSPASGLATVALAGDSVAQAYDAMPEGATRASFTLNLGKPLETRTALRNVIGLLRGSDPKLNESYILLTAHYDGQGGRPGTEGGWNSANDNGSGTAAVVEIASILGSLKERPRRSLVFMTFYGEEMGLVGSRFYGQHPVFPIDQTIAEINLEMVGRTDDIEGDQHKRASLTGFDYSDLSEVFLLAGERMGVTVFKHEKNSGPYFGRSDNQALADLGVPAHTLCVTFAYPDYHGAADTWEKIDYDNMALTVRMIASGLVIMAQSNEEPRWNASVPAAGKYLEAWKRLHRIDK